MNQKLYKKLVWDYKISSDEFEKILDGRTKIGNFDQNWAVGRVLENLNYYDAMDLVSFKTLKNNWDNVKKRIFADSVKKGYEFVLRRQAVSATG